MKVASEFEVKHFIRFVNENKIPVNVEIVDANRECYLTLVNDEQFEIFKDVFSLIKIKCPNMRISNKIIH
tara:strand:+ start:46360 stop:46569 length:210 start_codon:yes stop_codon:yes gene_type:complete